MLFAALPINIKVKIFAHLGPDHLVYLSEIGSIPKDFERDVCLVCEQILGDADFGDVDWVGDNC